MEFGTSLVLNAAAFTIVYKTLPKVPIRWPEAARGAILVVAGWKVARQLLAGPVIGARHSAYGVVGALPAAMLWAYYAASIIFLEAEYIQTICGRCDPKEEVSI